MKLTKRQLVKLIQEQFDRKLKKINEHTQYNWEKDDFIETLKTDEYTFIIIPEYDYNGRRRKIGSWAVEVDYMDVFEELKGRFKTKNLAKQYAINKYLKKSLNESKKVTEQEKKYSNI